MLNNTQIVQLVKGFLEENIRDMYENDIDLQKSLENLEDEFDIYCEEELIDRYFDIITDDLEYHRCADCGEWCENDDVVVVYDTWHEEYVEYCENCSDYNNNIFYCEYHNQMEFDENCHKIENYGKICESAWEDGEFFTCENCYNEFHVDDLCSTDYECFCPDCYEEQGFDIISEYHESDFDFQMTENDTEEVGIGFELETEFDTNYMDFARDIHEFDNIHLEHDCSLRNGFEIITNPMTYNYFNEEFATIVDKIVDVCANGYNYQHNSAGFHVHTTKIDNMQTAKLMFLVEYFKEELKTMAKRDESQLKRWAPFYTEGIEKAEFDIDMFDKFYEMVENDNESRYQALNITNYHTNEFRIFKGGMDALEIKARVELCHNFAQYSMNESINIDNMPSFIEVATYCDNNYVTDYLHREFEEFCQSMGI